MSDDLFHRPPTAADLTRLERAGIRYGRAKKKADGLGQSVEAS